jgi:hypothetical protein
LIAFDYITGVNGDLVIANGDFQIAESDGQHIESILIAVQGDYKQYPLVGVNLRSYLNSPSSPDVNNMLRKKIQLQLEVDGYRVDEIKVGTDLSEIPIKAERVK